MLRTLKPRTGRRARIMRGRLLSSCFLMGCCLSSCNPQEKPETGHAQARKESGADQPIEPLPRTSQFDAASAALGEALFKEPLLSGDGKVACSSCHRADHGLADTSERSFVAGRPQTPVNTPGLYNVRYLYKLNWSGKFDSLEAQLDALIRSPDVMASSWDGIAKRLADVPAYRDQFGRQFHDGLTASNVRRAVIEYERSLVTPNSAFDRFLGGDLAALSVEAKRGYALFKGDGCASCHQGIAIGGNLFQRFGVVRDYFVDRGNVTHGDLGRFNVTAREEDRFVFRVPSLRNVALTAPYFHDGSAATLEDAVRVMAQYQLGRELEPKDRDDLVAFLRSLTGEYRGRAP